MSAINRIPFYFDAWVKNNHPNCFLEDGREIKIDRICFFARDIETIFYRFKEYDGYVYLDKRPDQIFMEKT